MTRRIIHYDPQLKELARKLRNNSTLGEIILWKRLRGKQMLGYDFHRQKPIGQYIVDFFCNELDLAIEIDGISHDSVEAQEKDNTRQKHLEAFGIRFLRFTESEIRSDVNSVINKIAYWIKENHKIENRHTPDPSLRRTVLRCRGEDEN
jgi:very-short-patch-repair endonuclease